MTQSTKVKVRTIGNLIVFIIKMSAASGIAWEIAKLAGSKHPYLAPLSAILCLQTTIFQSIRFSLHRLLGTVLGVALTLWAADRMALNGWTLALLLALVSAISLLIDRKESVIQQVALSVLLVFALQKQSDHYGLDRIRDTFIGVAVGLAVHMIIYPPNLVKQADSRTLVLMKSLSERFTEAAAWIQNGCPEDQKNAVQSELQMFQKKLFQAEKQMEKADESTKINLTAQSSHSLLQNNQNRVALMKQGADCLERTVTIAAEWNSTGTLLEPERKQWANFLRRIGSYWSSPTPEAADLSAASLEPPPMQIELDELQRYSAAIYTETSAFLKQLHRLS
ncbi:aromatic acid exporter family protein [Paenibacillus terreus]|uniref:Aromatic acid exporter family protein n=1 Tax=Paenibacillus terreus TaxID=1387834 RepID=A0ABV5B7Z8_9BACL